MLIIHTVLKLPSKSSAFGETVSLSRKRDVLQSVYQREVNPQYAPYHLFLEVIYLSRGEQPFLYF